MGGWLGVDNGISPTNNMMSQHGLIFESVLNKRTNAIKILLHGELLAKYLNIDQN